jgi:hypothetical protein
MYTYTKLVGLFANIDRDLLRMSHGQIARAPNNTSALICTLSNGNWRPGIITMQPLSEYLVMINDGHGRFGFWVYVSWLVTNLHSVNAIFTALVKHRSLSTGMVEETSTPYIDIPTRVTIPKCHNNLNVPRPRSIIGNSFFCIVLKTGRFNDVGRFHSIFLPRRRYQALG